MKVKVFTASRGRTLAGLPERLMEGKKEVAKSSGAGTHGPMMSSHSTILGFTASTSPDETRCEPVVLQLIFTMIMFWPLLGRCMKLKESVYKFPF